MLCFQSIIYAKTLYPGYFSPRLHVFGLINYAGRMFLGNLMRWIVRRRANNSSIRHCFSKSLFIFVNVKGLTTPLMALLTLLNSMNQTDRYVRKQEKTYVSPAIRIVPMMTDFSFLQSNTEPIDDGGEQGWD